MNTLELLKARAPIETNIQRNYLSIAPTNSRIVKRKAPQTRISYLKKLFSQNIKVPDDQQMQQKNIYEKQKKAFQQSRIIVHSNKNINKYYMKELTPNKSQETFQYCKKNGNEDLTKQNQMHNYNSQYKKNKRKNVNQNIKQNQYDNQRPSSGHQKKIKFLLRNQKSQSQKTSLNSSKLNYTQSIERKSRYGKGKSINESMVQNQKNKFVKKEIKELRKIGQLLEDIKYEIIKNRSVILQGMKQIRSIDKKSKKQKIVQEIIQMDQKQKQLNKIIPINYKTQQNQTNQHIRYSVGPKPYVQYKNLHKYR